MNPPTMSDDVTRNARCLGTPTPSLPVRVVYFGTGAFACPALRMLRQRTDLAQVVGVVTQPDKPQGRSMKLAPSPVKEVAVADSVPVWQPPRARNPEFIAELGALNPDLIVVAAYGQILPQALLDVPRFGCLNLHGSILPAYRGAAPIQWAMMDGRRETGVTLMRMDAGLDTGDMLAVRTTGIRDDDDLASLHDRLALLSGELLVDSLPAYLSGGLKASPQPNEGVSYARKIVKEDGLVDWRQPSEAVWNRVRGSIPWPGAFTHVIGPDGRPFVLKLWKARRVPEDGLPGTVLAGPKTEFWVACGTGAVAVTEVQREGGKRMAAQDFLRGFPMAPGAKLGVPPVS